MNHVIIISFIKLWCIALHEAGLKRGSIQTVQNVLRPAFEEAVEDDASVAAAFYRAMVKIG